MEVFQLCLGVLEKFDGKIFEGKRVAADARDVKLNQLPFGHVELGKIGVDISLP